MASVFDHLFQPIETEADVVELMVQELRVAEHHNEVLGFNLEISLEFTFDVKLC